MNMINKHNLPPSGKVILLSKLKCGLLLTISLATVSFNTINVPTSLCNNGILFFACHSIIIMSAYCTFPTIIQSITLVPKCTPHYVRTV